MKRPRIARSARQLYSRASADLMPLDRSAEYAGSIRQAKAAGYEVDHVQGFEARVREQAIRPGQRILVLRHDADIRDVRGNAMFYEAEVAAGVHSTFYFRLSTAPPHRDLIRRLTTSGHEVGYHFEEGATIAKSYRLRSREEVFEHRDEIVDLFVRNAAAFRRTWNPALASVSSHGDWINRRLRFSNNELLDHDVLTAAGVDFEAYESHVMGAAEVYVSDVAPFPQRWTGDRSLDAAIEAGRTPIYCLTHERRWHTSQLATIHQDALRFAETVRYGSSWSGPR